MCFPTFLEQTVVCEVTNNKCQLTTALVCCQLFQILSARQIQNESHRSSCAFIMTVGHCKTKKAFNAIFLTQLKQPSQTMKAWWSRMTSSGCQHSSAQHNSQKRTTEVPSLSITRGHLDEDSVAKTSTIKHTIDHFRATSTMRSSHVAMWWLAQHRNPNKSIWNDTKIGNACACCTRVSTPIVMQIPVEQ